MDKGSGVSFDLTEQMAKVGSVNIAPNNFEAYIGKIKKSIRSCKTQFGMAREHCGHRDGYEYCKHPGNRLGYANTYCKLECCPFLR